MKIKETNAYYKMLRELFVLNQKPDDRKFTPTKVDLVTFLDIFHKNWKKYYSKEFKPAPKTTKREGTK